MNVLLAVIKHVPDDLILRPSRQVVIPVALTQVHSHPALFPGASTAGPGIPCGKSGLPRLVHMVNQQLGDAEKAPFRKFIVSRRRRPA